ncbi:unnamed protein product [Penicillium pancosmium]
MAYTGRGGDPWKIPVELAEDPKYLSAAAARGAFQIIDSAILFGLFGLACFVRYGVPCVARRGRFQGEVYQFKSLSFALITYAICSCLEGSIYLLEVADTVVTFGYLWIDVLSEMFRSLANCSTIFLFYRCIHWFLVRIHKDSMMTRVVKVSHWTAFVVMCCHTAATWAWIVYDNVFVVESTHFEEFAYHDLVLAKMISARRILWWLFSLEISAWFCYSTFKLYRGRHRSARNAGLFAVFGSLIFFALSFTWAIVSIQWVLIETDESWGLPSQLAVIVLELVFTTAAYLGILLTCMKLAVLGDDLDDKAYAPAIWTEEEADKTDRNLPQDVSRPVSPIDEESGYAYPVCEKRPMKLESSSVAYRAVSSNTFAEMEGSSNTVVEMEGSSQRVVEMEGSTHQVVEADAGVYDFPKAEKVPKSPERVR